MVEHHGGVDILVNNAGWDVVKPFLQTSVDEWMRLIDINLVGALHMLQAQVQLLHVVAVVVVMVVAAAVMQVRLLQVLVLLLEVQIQVYFLPLIMLLYHPLVVRMILEI